MLLVGALASLGLSYTTEAWAASPSQSVNAVQQAKKVTGNVSDAEGPIIGASVVEKGNPNNGTVTDLDGNFTLNVKPGATIVITYIGYQKQEIAVGNQANVKVTMKTDDKSLEEVVVVGYGVQKKKLVTGATVQVKGDDIAKLSTTNALTAMQSSTPGVQITQSSAQPGKGFKVNVRGVGTMGNSSPLLVIDGIQAGTADDGLNGLNPGDIESIDILKDAASSSIYGVAAANGVILVTTKQGKAGKVQASYDAYMGWSNPYRRPSTLNAQEYMQVVNETNFNTYGTLTDWKTLVPDDIYEKLQNGWEGTDWFDLYRNKNAVQMNHTFNLTGGSDRSKFSMGLSYTSNEGTMGGDNASDYKRYTGRINSEHILLKAKDRDVITIGENISYWYTNSHELAEGNGYSNIMQPVYTASPLTPAFNADGSLTSYEQNGRGFSSMIFFNPLNGLYNGEYNTLNKKREFGVGATFYVNVQPIKNLNYKFTFNTGFSGGNQRYASQPYSVSNTDASVNYGLEQKMWESGSYMFNQTLSYKLPDFIKKNHIDVMVGQEFTKSDWSMNMATKATVNSTSDAMNSLLNKGFAYNWLSNYSAADISGFSGNPNLNSARLSLFGRLNWNYDEKYMATFVLRADKSSKFDRDHRWGYFPSVSAGWLVSSEKFMDVTKSWMDYLKIRASWGQNGNDAIDDLQYLSRIAMSPTDYADYAYKFSSAISNSLANNAYSGGAFTKNVANKEVTWETSEQLDLGFDARFLNQRLGLSFDWYNKKTKDWLVKAPIEWTMGVGNDGAPYINGGDVENKGVEIALSWNDKVGKDFNYRANLNIATNTNKVTRLQNLDYIIGDVNAIFQNSSYVSRVQVGEPIGYFYGMSYSGIWQNQKQIDDARAAGKAVLDGAQPGDMIWDDFDGDGVINYDKDRHNIGNPHPDMTIGATLGFDWKGLDFSITGSGQFGMQVMQCYRTALLANQYLNYTRDVFDRWHGEGTSNTQPRLCVGSTNDQWVSSRYVHDADFFRIQNITLGYDFNKLWKNSPFQQLRLYFQAQNLVTFTSYTGVDPEVGSNGGKDSWASGIDVGLYPTSRTYMVGVNIKF